MKIKILTYHRAHNYGAVLQAFALKEIIKDLGYEVEIIDYWSWNHQGDYQLIPKFRRSSIRSTLSSFIQLLVKIIPILARRYRFNFFIRNFLVQRSGIIRLKEDLEMIQSDLIVLGSDQIWRKSNYADTPDYEWEYFGDYFGPKTSLISYAASMGVVSSSKTEITNIIKRLKKFKKISVRELNLKETLLKNGLDNVKQVLDPCFLLGKDQWTKIFNLHSTDEKYILVYNLRESKKIDLQAKEISNQLGFKIIRITGNANNWYLTNYTLQGSGPIGFLNLIKNAQFVISSSFHGVVFSIIFERQFLAMDMEPNSSRVTSLLDGLKLSERYSNGEIQTLTKINYNLVRNKLAKAVGNSLDFLKNSFSE